MKINKPVLILLRGAPATGKTTVARYIRSQKRKFVWICYDQVRVFVYKYPTQNKKLIFEAVRSLAKFFLEKNFSVIIEELFVRVDQIEPFFDLGKKLNIKVYLFELEANLNDILDRNPKRPFPLKGGAKEAIRLYRLISNNVDKRAVKIDTSKLDFREAANLILDKINANN